MNSETHRMRWRRRIADDGRSRPCGVAARARHRAGWRARFVAVCAHIALPLHFTPVPLTLQPFAVLLLGLLLSPRLAAATLAAYLVEGAAGSAGVSPGPVAFRGTGAPVRADGRATCWRIRLPRLTHCHALAHAAGTRCGWAHAERRRRQPADPGYRRLCG